MYKVYTFFYGSYINKKVLEEVNIFMEVYEAAKLPGFDISIKPFANLIKSAKDCVYGILTQLTHEELKKLYSHAEEVFHEVYEPEAVLVQTADDKWVTALCYICHNMEERRADKDYVERIIQPAKEYNFPNWYIEKLASF
jgi:tRNA G10  N-methylase Trm11